MFDFSAKRLILATLICSATAASAQNGRSNKEVDPYSRYGYGMPMTGTNVSLRGMGYASTAFSSSTAVNPDNPASYSALKFTTYEAGVTGSMANLINDNTSYHTSSANLAYLRLGIPIGKKGGISLGLAPMSHVFYHSSDSASAFRIERPGGDTTYWNRTVNDHTGEGGLSYLYLGAAYRIGLFSIGANFGYSFGNIAYTSKQLNADSTHVLSSSFTSITNYGGIYWKGGIQFHDTIGSFHLRLGATATLSQDLNGKQQAIYSSILTLGPSSEIDDTVYHADGAKGKMTIPASYAFGAQISRSNWSVAADYTITNWSQFRNYDKPDSLRDKTFRLNVGAEFTPDPTNLYNYVSRISYRIGFYYGTDYVQLRNQDMHYYALTLGTSLPFKRTSDRIHMAVELGRRGTENSGLVLENFYRFHFGLSLNDKWFIKKRYD
jgi:hypothetical protein